MLNHQPISKLSPILLAGMLTKPLPLAPVNFILRKIIHRLRHNHPAIISRLEPVVGISFLVVLEDLPFNIQLCIEDDDIKAFCVREKIASDVRICGKFMKFVQMLEGEEDGDALFFSRDLVVEGNTEALLTLRNALDSEDISISKEILEQVGIFKIPADIAMSGATSIYDMAQENLRKINNFLMSGVQSRCDEQEITLNKLNEKVSSLEEVIARQQKQLDKRILQ